jgi:hypothetical protein
MVLSSERAELVHSNVSGSSSDDARDSVDGRSASDADSVRLLAGQLK